MYELFPARCMVSPYEVEETRYGQVTVILAANIIPIGVRYMKNKICSVI